MGKAIHVENLTVKYEQTTALDNVSLDVNTGEFIAIMGPNGGGKSTLLKAILGLIPFSNGKIEVFDQQISKSKEQISYVPQFSQVDRKFPVTAIEVVMTAYVKKGIHPLLRFNSKDRSNALDELDFVGIKDLAGRQISQLSGGEFQRLLIARALAANPRILFLDEPTASVDPNSRAKIYELLKDLNSKRGMTIVMVTHDLNAVSSVVNRIACLNGTLVYHGEPSLTKDIVDHMYGCPVDLIAHGVPHRVLAQHLEDKKID